MKLIPVSSPDGVFDGWISPSLIVAVDAQGHIDYVHPRMGMRVGRAPYQMPSIIDLLELKRP